jgi:hypothetical protein
MVTMFPSMFVDRHGETCGKIFHAQPLLGFAPAKSCRDTGGRFPDNVKEQSARTTSQDHLFTPSSKVQSHHMVKRR